MEYELEKILTKKRKTSSVRLISILLQIYLCGIFTKVNL